MEKGGKFHIKRGRGLKYASFRVINSKYLREEGCPRRGKGENGKRRKIALKTDKKALKMHLFCVMNSNNFRRGCLLSGGGTRGKIASKTVKKALKMQRRGLKINLKGHLHFIYMKI